MVEFDSGRVNKRPSTAKLKTDFGRQQPVTEGVRDRMKMYEVPSFADRFIEGKDAKDAAKVFDPNYAKSKARKHVDWAGTYNKYNGVLRPEYDMLEAFTIADTEGYLKQAINRKLALMFRNGYEITSDLDQDIDQGQKNVDYIYKRLNQMEFINAMGESTDAFFKKLLYNLLLISNVFLRKVRDEKLSGGVRNNGDGGRPDNKNKVPIAYYQIIPAHSILPYFEQGTLVKWRRFFETGTPYEDYTLDEIIHICWDRKPGHIFGTPRTVGVRDDMFALRRLEENIELLFINHLFPFFHVKIGSTDAPCLYGPNGESEIDSIRYQVETMPKEGIFVTDERVEVDVVGAEGKSLEVKEFIAHLKARVFTGLGVSAIDMGEGADATRATADNISQNLKDFVKADMEAFGDLMRLNFFKEWFMEANYSVSLQKAVSTTKLVFHEIDLDNLVKEQSHILNLYNGHLLTEPEARKKFKMPPMTKEQKKQTHYWEHVRDLVIVTAKAKADADVKAQKELMPEQQKHAEIMTGHEVGKMQMQHKLEHKKMEAHVAKAQASTTLTNAKTRLAAVQGPRLGGAAKKATPSSGTTRTRVQPTNQHKTNPGPTRAKSSREEFQGILRDELLKKAAELKTTERWPIESAKVVDQVLAAFETKHPENPEDPTNDYTKQVRQTLPALKGIVAQTTDPEMLAVLIDAWDGEDDDERSED